MADLYLLSAMVNGVETFYTADSGGTISAIGTRLNWTKGFDEVTLAAIGNDTYSTLSDPKIYCDNVKKVSAAEEMTGDGIVWTTDATAINCDGYSGVTKITASGSTNNRYAISFSGSHSYYTRGQGTVASNTAAIPTTASSRNSSGVRIPTGTDNMFDGNTATKYVVSPSADTDIDIQFNNAFIARRTSITIAAECRLPVIATFSVYDTTTNKWVELDKITIKVSKTVNRYFENKISSNSYRWTLAFDTSLFGDDPSKDLVVTTANIYGETTGTAWIPCSREEVPTKGMTASTLAALTSADYSTIFNQYQIDYVAYIPAGGTLTNVVATFPTNAAPVVDDVIADRTSVHAGNVALMFTITDPEGSICSYEIMVNGKIVDGGNNLTSGSRCRVDMDNSWFNAVDDENTIPVEKNKITIIAKDEYGASSTSTYDITKIDKVPTYTGILKDNTYTMNVDDADRDKVKYVAFLNGKKIFESDFKDVPFSNESITMSTKDILIGKKNELKILLVDVVGGVTTIKETFIGEYYGLLYLDDNGNLLSTDLGEALNKLTLNSIVCGQTSLAQEVVVWNKTSGTITNIAIKSPKDINGIDTPQYNNGVFVGNTHKTGDIWVQLSNNDSFEDSDTFYGIALKNLAANEKTSFFVRVASENPGAQGGTFEFDVTGVANN